MVPLEELLTPDEVGAILKVTRGVLAQWRHAGVGIPFVKVRKTVRYRRADVQAYLDANLMLSTRRAASEGEVRA